MDREAADRDRCADFDDVDLPMPMPESNRRQAMVPRGAKVLANARGSAPGLWIDHGDRLVLLLPGPPREMKAMFAASVIPRLAGRTSGRRIRRRVIKTTGWPESQYPCAPRSQASIRTGCWS